jgi:hypothetical protein
MAPAPHWATHAMEWPQGGFSEIHLCLDYLAFVPMPWLLLGLCVVRQPKPDLMAIAGAISYGAAFTYFTFATLYAIPEHIPNYELLRGDWGRPITLMEHSW